MARTKLLFFFLFFCNAEIFAFNIFSDTLVIPFEHKQSAIVHKNTLTVLDSVVLILNQNKDITLSIEGYAYVDEGNDTICKYLSLNRALFVRDCITGRGIDSSRITFIKAMGQWKPEKKGKYKVNNDVHSRVELLLIYPPPPPKIVIADADEDGIADTEDGCPEKYGYVEDSGCPLKDVTLINFDYKQVYISSKAFPVMDKLLKVLKDNSSYTIALRSHAAKDEGIRSVCDRLAEERSNILLRYVASRNFPASRIDSVTNYGKSKPVNPQRNPQELGDNASVEIILNRHSL